MASRQTKFGDDRTAVEAPENPREEQQEQEKPELQFDHGELAPWWASPFPAADLTDDEQKELKRLCDLIGNMDVAARRMEVEQAWQARLYDRGYQYLWPRRGGGWIYIPYATDYQRTGSRSGVSAWYGNETNIYATYGEIITAALTRDIPVPQFDPQNPSSDADITAAKAAEEYAKVFSRANDLLNFQQQLVYYLRTDGRALIVTDHIISAQHFGRCDPDTTPVVPETEKATPPVAYAIRHGETPLNENNEARGRTETTIDDRGEREMGYAGDWLKDKGITLLVSSPLPRTIDSAQVLSEKLGVPVEVDDRLASLDIGSLAGEKDASGEVDEAFEKPDEPIAGGETPEQFESRISEAVMEWLAKGACVGFVVHDSVISQIFKMFEGDDLPAGSTTEPGWVVGICRNDDGTFRPMVVYPVTPPEVSIGQQRGKPRGQEVSKSYGKLEHKLPFNAGAEATLDLCMWAQVSEEHDVAAAKAAFPDKADLIKPGGASAGENQLDRIARINATLALMGSYVTGDSMVRDCTIQRTWMRPGYFMACEDARVRQGLMEKFPDGVLVIQAGDEFICARNESMDDHLTLVHALPGSGMNRLALCSKLLSLQNRLNNWVDLLDQYFIRCVPMRYLPAGVFDINAINNQPTVVGGFLSYSLQELQSAGGPQMTLQAALAMDNAPQPQPAMLEAIQWFFLQFPQLLAHALPALFGAESNQDTWRGQQLQRDQALESNGTPWHAIKVAFAGVFKQAVQLAARCRTECIEGMDKTGTKIRIELANLKGNIMAHPTDEANFPESWVQRQSRWQQILMDAATNPMLTQLLASIPNRMKALDVVGLDLADPDAAGYEKQMGEFEILCRTGPVPNPAYLQLQDQLAQAQTVLQNQQGLGVMVGPQDLQRIAQLEQQLQATPPEVSTVPVKDTDNHMAEATATLEKINSPEGRRLANGTPEEQAAFQNLTLHYQEHKAKAPAPPPAGALPKGVSLNLKDAPPDAMADALKNVGLEAQGGDVVQTREFQAELKKTSKIGGGPVPGTQVTIQ